MNKCYDCKWYKETETKGIFNRTDILTICSNPQTFQKTGIWYPDGNSVKIDNNPPYVEVGSNFGCINWESKDKDQSESQKLVKQIRDLLED